MHAQSAGQTRASVPYTPSWTARHHLQLLGDHADLPLTLSHWPLPAAAVRQALDRLADDADVQAARSFVIKELDVAQNQGRAQLHLRSQSEGLNGFGENYTPGSSAQLSSPEWRSTLGDVSVAGRLGVRAEARPNSLETQVSGVGPEGVCQVGAVGSGARRGCGGGGFF